MHPRYPTRSRSAYLALRHTLLRRPRAALRRPARPGAGNLGPAHPLPAAAHGHGRRRRDPARAPTRTGPASPPRWKPPKTSSPPPAGSARTARPTCPALIGRAVLATLLPARRLRFSARKVKCATSRYLNRDDGRPPHPAAITAIDITISTPPAGPAARPDPPSTAGTPPRRPGRPPAGNGSPPSSPATPRATGAATTSPCSSTSNPGTCSPSSANGHGWGSSPAPASAPTTSTRRRSDTPSTNPPDP